jgi:26S proteasome regulatory subunit N11
MLSSLHKKNWTLGLQLTPFDEFEQQNEAGVSHVKKLTQEYVKSVHEEGQLSKEDLATRHVGKIDPKRHLDERVTSLMSANILQIMGSSIDAAAF